MKLPAPLLLICLTLGGEACLKSDDCGQSVNAAKTSPSGRMQAGAIVSACGATVGYYTLVVVQPSGHPVEAERKDAALMVPGVHQIYFSWGEDGALLVDVPAGPLIEQRLEVNGVKVRYRSSLSRQAAERTLGR